MAQPQPSPAPQPLAEEPNSPATRSEDLSAFALNYCPVCSTKLESRKCKLFCAQCGYYMSCADYI